MIPSFIKIPCTVLFHLWINITVVLSSNIIDLIGTPSLIDDPTNGVDLQLPQKLATFMNLI